MKHAVFIAELVLGAILISAICEAGKVPPGGTLVACICWGVMRGLKGY